MNKVVSIVVTYNRKELLKEVIEALINQSFKTDIFIIDNHSNDNTFGYIERYINNNDIKYFDTENNLGGAGGFNFGIKKALEYEYDYIWIMDDDCIPNYNALEELMIAKDKLRNDFGYLSSKVLWKDNSISLMNIQKKSIFKKIKDFDLDMQEIKLASFVSLFLKREVIKDIGLPIKDFFVWTDDWEYTARISKKYKSYYIKDSVVIHKSNSNIGANIVECDVDKIDRFNYLYRNDVYFYSKEGFKGFIYECLRLIYHSIKVILKAKNKRFKRLKTIWSATIKGLSFKPEIEYK